MNDNHIHAFNSAPDEQPTEAPRRRFSKDFHRAALEKLKGRWIIAIVAAALALILGGVDSIVTFNLDFSVKAGTLNEQNDAAHKLSEGLDSALDGIIADYLTRELEIPQEIADELTSLFILIVIVGLISFISLMIFVSSPVKLGYRKFLLETVDENDSGMTVGTLFSFFKKGYLKSVRLNLLYSLLNFAAAIPLIAATAFGALVLVREFTRTDMQAADSQLQLLALLIGIELAGVLISLISLIAVRYIYGFSFIIMADYPDISALSALHTSRNLMRGKKWRLFCLDMSFLGWYLLAAIFTLGLGILAVTPYHYTARAAFYNEISKRKDAADKEFPSIDPNADDTDGEFDPKNLAKSLENMRFDSDHFSDATTAEEDSPTADGLDMERMTKEIEFPSLDLDDL